MATKQLHIDQLEEFYLRDDLSRLTPGTRILFGHVRTVDAEQVNYATSPAEVWSEVVTVHDVGEYSHYDLHPRTKTADGEAGRVSASLSEKVLRIRYTSDALRSGTIASRHAVDAGVLPTSSGFYNGTNFTVLLSDLEAAGVELILTPSPGYLEKQQVFNALYEEKYGAIDRYLDDAIFDALAEDYLTPEK